MMKSREGGGDVNVDLAGRGSGRGLFPSKRTARLELTDTALRED